MNRGKFLSQLFADAGRKYLRNKSKQALRCNFSETRGEACFEVLECKISKKRA